MAIAREEFTDVILEFFEYAANYEVCIANMDRFGEGNSKSYETYAILGLPVFSNDSKATKDGYIQDYNGIFYTSAKDTEAIGLTFDKMQVGDKITFLNETFEVIDIEQQGNSAGQTFVLVLIFFRKIKS